jgi:hypothetical protein
MKKKIFTRILGTIVGIGSLTLSTLPALAQNTSSVSPNLTTSSQTAPTLSYGAANVLKLAHANVGEETILAYVQKSGQGYGDLGASEIIYLHDQGVSDRIVTAMLDQEKKTRDAAVAQYAAQQATVTAAPPASPTATVAAAPQYQPTYTPPPVTYVQTAPAPLIVMRDSSPRLVDYGIYPRYGFYGGYPRYGYGGYGYRGYGYSYPAVSFSFGYNSSSCGPTYRGGYHYSGGHYSGGSHGGHHR